MTPIPELSGAAQWLSEAADCVVAGRLHEASHFVAKADLPLIAAYTAFVTGAINPLVHWQASMPAEMKDARRSEQRMPSASCERAIYARDGWRCRYCGTRVIERAMRTKLNRLMPETARWGARNADKHSALAALSASLDHVTPHSRGGSNEESNLMTACNACQFGRGQWTLEEVGFLDPREFPPVCDSWDGLTRLDRVMAPAKDIQ